MALAVVLFTATIFKLPMIFNEDQSNELEDEDYEENDDFPILTRNLDFDISDLFKQYLTNKKKLSKI